jgi:hypothetical protein
MGLLREPDSPSRKEAIMADSKDNKLSTFLLKLGEDAATAREFRADPVATMTKAGLSESDKQIVLRGNAHELSQVLGPAIAWGGGGKIVVVVVVVVVAAK